ncbi:MAG: hypothetical protein AAGU02_09335, partial [Lawsonibacter sp.]
MDKPNLRFDDIMNAVRPWHHSRFVIIIAHQNRHVYFDPMGPARHPLSFGDSSFHPSSYSRR